MSGFLDHSPCAMAGINPQRVAQRLADLHVSARAVSIRVAGKPGFVQNILNGAQQSTSRERSERLAAALECSVAFLYDEADEPGSPPKVKLPPIAAKRPRLVSTQRSSKTEEQQSSGMEYVPEYDVRLSAGGGSIITEEEAKAQWGLPQTFLRSMRLDARQLSVVSIVGESMEPLLRDGDMVMLDLRSTNPSLPGIYALWEGTATVCKRLETVHGSDPPKLRVMSVNPAYSTYEILAEEASIIGRVAWFGRRT